MKRVLVKNGEVVDWQIVAAVKIVLFSSKLWTEKELTQLLTKLKNKRDAKNA
jgi:hypothetical protein